MVNTSKQDQEVADEMFSRNQPEADAAAAADDAAAAKAAC